MCSLLVVVRLAVSVQASFTDAGAYQGVAPVGTGSDGALSLEAFDERVVFCGDMDDLKGQLRAAGNKLVLLEVRISASSRKDTLTRPCVRGTNLCQCLCPAAPKRLRVRDQVR